jgi:hypothetical protein
MAGIILHADGNDWGCDYIRGLGESLHQRLKTGSNGAEKT